MGRFVNKTLYALGHYSHKLKCNMVFYKILSPFFNNCDVSEVKPLEDFWQDGGSSCICKNKISETLVYDLQIVVPCYNVEKYVTDCVDSILSQKTCFSFKVVFVNDGSTDGTLELLRKYEERDNVTLINQENRGFSGARNAGFAEIDSKYLMFVDSDDVLYPDSIEVLLSKAYALDADIVEGGYERFCGESVLYSRLHEDSDDNKGISGFPWGKVYKSSMFRSLKFPEGYWFEDTFCTMILNCYANRTATVSDVVYRWRKNTTSISFQSKGNVRTIDSFWVTKRLLEDRRTLGLPFDDAFMEVFLHQVKVNFLRIASMGIENIDKAVFQQTVYLMKEFFSTKVDDVNPLERALLESDYKSYRLECLFD